MRRTLAAVFAVLLVTGAVGGTLSLMGEDSPVDDLSPVDGAQAAIATGTAIAIAAVAGGTGLTIGAFYLGSTDPGEEEETIQQKINFYETALQNRAYTESVDSIATNGVRSSDLKLFAEGMRALNESAQNETSASTAVKNMKRVVNNRTAVKEHNWYTTWEVAVLAAQNIENQSDADSNISDSFAQAGTSASHSIGNGGFALSVTPETAPNGSVTVTKTLENGSSYEVRALEIKVTEDLSYSSGSISNTQDNTTTLRVYPGGTWSKTVTWQYTDSYGDHNYDATVPDAPSRG